MKVFFSIVIPVFNEEENIIKLINEIINVIKKTDEYEIVIVNDCSNDNTLNKLHKLNIKNLSLYNHDKNLGQSKAIQTGILNSKYNYIITIDGDGQNDPADILKILDIFMSNNNLKLISGVRKKRMDKFSKILASKIANKIRSLILNDHCPDTGCSLKFFDKNIFLNFPFFNGIHRFIPSLFEGYGFEVKYFSVNHRKREYGNSKYNNINRLFRGIKDLFHVRSILKGKNK